MGLEGSLQRVEQRVATHYSTAKHRSTSPSQTPIHSKSRSILPVLGVKLSRQPHHPNISPDLILPLPVAPKGCLLEDRGVTQIHPFVISGYPVLIGFTINIPDIHEQKARDICSTGIRSANNGTKPFLFCECFERVLHLYSGRLGWEWLRAGHFTLGIYVAWSASFPAGKCHLFDPPLSESFPRKALASHSSTLHFRQMLQESARSL